MYRAYLLLIHISSLVIFSLESFIFQVVAKKKKYFCWINDTKTFSLSHTHILLEEEIYENFRDNMRKMKKETHIKIAIRRVEERVCEWLGEKTFFFLHFRLSTQQIFCVSLVNYIQHEKKKLKILIIISQSSWCKFFTSSSFPFWRCLTTWANVWQMKNRRYFIEMEKILLSFFLCCSFLCVVR